MMTTSMRFAKPFSSRTFHCRPLRGLAAAASVCCTRHLLASSRARSVLASTLSTRAHAASALGSFGVQWLTLSEYFRSPNPRRPCCSLLKGVCRISILAVRACTASRCAHSSTASPRYSLPPTRRLCCSTSGCQRSAWWPSRWSSWTPVRSTRATNCTTISTRPIDWEVGSTTAGCAARARACTHACTHPSTHTV